MPFLSPSKWREMISAVFLLNDKQIRTVGLISMLLGVGLLYAFN